MFHDNKTLGSFLFPESISEAFNISNDLGLITPNFANRYENIFTLGGKDLGEGQSLGTRRAD